MLWKLINWFSLIRHIGVLDGYCEDLEEFYPTSALKNRGLKESAPQVRLKKKERKKVFALFVKESSILWRKSLKPKKKKIIYFFLGAFGADAKYTKIISYLNVSAPGDSPKCIARCLQRINLYFVILAFGWN